MTFLARIAFGGEDARWWEWRGTFSLQGGDLSAVEGWLLGNQDRLSLSGFEIQPYHPYFEKPEPKGILLEGRALPGARIIFHTNHGNLQFSLEQLSPEREIQFLEGGVRVSGMRGVEKLSDDTRQDDYPSIAVRGTSAWVVWQSYGSRADQIRLRKYDGVWKTFTPVPGAAGDLWRPQVALDGSGKVWVFWSGQVKGNFDLYARALDEESGQWGPLLRLSHHPGPDLDVQVAADSQGRLWLVWQGFRQGQSDIFLRCYDGHSWSPEMLVSEDPANDWQPRLAADSRGGVHVVWDTYRAGNYDVYLRSWDGRQWGAETPVASTPLFEAHPAVAVDADDRIWIAWDEGGSQWGKDSGLTADPEWRRKGRDAWNTWIDQPSRPGTRLYESRRIKLVVLEGGQRKVPVENLREVLKGAGIDEQDHPQLLFDPRSRRLALLFHHWRQTVPTEKLGFRRPSWEKAVLFYQGNRWTRPYLLPRSAGRPSMPFQAAFAGDGSLWLVWPTDGRSAHRAIQKLEGTIYAGRLSLPQSSLEPQLQEAPPEKRWNSEPVHPRESQEVAAVRAYRTFIRGQEYRILRGDLHRHTEFSWDSRGNLDGSLFDFYRYMLDVAAMDFGAVTDHNSGGDSEYAWWLIEKSCDLYYLPESFVTLYGYERSLPFPFGHRNIFHIRRGVPVVSFFTAPDREGPRPAVGVGQAQQVLADDTRLLYESLARTGGISIPHTTGTNMGTNWQDHDPQVEPVVEIFQGDRTSYEHPGGPRAPAREEEHAIGGYREEGFVWNAYRKGYRMGTIASSDHWSTHLSYAMLYVQEPGRKAILEALRKRRTYGATDNIILDYRIGEHFMGEELTTGRLPRLEIRALGTSPISRIEIIKNEAVLYTATPQTREVRLTYLDQNATAGTSYYYVRLTQQDRQVAWSSPIWVSYQPE